MKERLIRFAKAMRHQPTNAESVIWAALRGARLQGFKFKRQQPIGAYIVDFICFECGLIVEIDGGQHADNDNVSADQARSNWLQDQGFKVLRFWNNEVIERQDDILESIIRALREYPSPQPLSHKGRGAWRASDGWHPSGSPVTQSGSGSLVTPSGARTSSTGTTIHVVAGILSDVQGRVLLAQRAHGSHLAGLWEFPGGKIEPGESAEIALRRELHEELAIDIGAIEPLISIPWHYPEKSIVLHALRVREFRGTPHGQQQQQLRWDFPDAMTGIPMPPPDRPIVNALRLPSYYAITPEPGSSDVEFLEGLQRVIARGVRIIQLRAKTVLPSRLRVLAQQARDEGRKVGATLLLNGNLQIARDLDLDGVHLPATELLSLDERPLGADRWVAASCHDERELVHAAAIGVDFAVLGPVLHTASHATTTPIGWQRFADLCAAAPFPVYALGGMSKPHRDAAKAAGAQGIAGISAFWS